MREIAVISGKGGTGKTTLAMSLLPYLKDPVIADCDVDAPDMKILLSQEEIHKEPFYGLQIPVFDYEKCIHCNLCQKSCAFNAISDSIELIPGRCEGCRFCEYVCPVDAITMENHAIGHLHKHETAYGPMVDAALFPGQESSGKLVSEVRERAIAMAKKTNRETILIDGSPGVACNVISTITGVDEVLVVTEPTLSGIHDLKRVVDLIRIFNIPTHIVINKATINASNAEAIKAYCHENGLDVLLEIPFDEAIVHDISQKTIPSLGSSTFFETDAWKHFVKQMRQTRR
ncbi:MAG: ATP-binding protein [Candidatus Izemoplasmataceae bacterium]